MNNRRIYLMGMKHTGKSQHGRALADASGRAFCDTDTLIQELDAAELGMRRTIRDIYLEDGAQRFRQLEAAACRLVAEREEPIVVATGGGLCDNPDAAATTDGGLRVHVVDSLEALTERIFRGGIPAFLHTDEEGTARERFRDLYQSRVAKYDTIADLRVDVSGKALAEARSILLSSIEEYLDARK